MFLAFTLSFLILISGLGSFAQNSVDFSPVPVVMHWSNDGTDLHISLVGKTGDAGWVGVGWTTLGNGVYMLGSDVVIGWPGNVTAYIPQDYDPSAVIYNTLMPITKTSCSRINGNTIVNFTRSLNSGGIPIAKNGTAYLIAAMGQHDKLEAHIQNSNSPIAVNFSAAPGPPSTPTPTPTPTPIPSPTPNSFTFPDLPINVEWNLKEDEGIISFKITGQTPGWIALGFSRDVSTGFMLKSDAILGWPDNVRAYYTKDYSIETVIPNDKLNITDVVCTQVDGKTVMEFTRKLDAGYNPIPKDGNSYLIGALSNVNVFQQHTQKSNTLFVINFKSGQISEKFNIEWLHGIFMELGWGILIPFGITFARYSRKLQSSPSDTTWFVVHRAINTAGFLFAVAGAVVALIMVNGNHFKTVWHGQVGISIMALLALQMFFAALRPHPTPKTSKRIVFEIYHHWNGRLATLMAWINIYSGINLFTSVPSMLRFVHVAVCCLWILVAFFLEIYWRLRKGYQSI